MSFKESFIIPYESTDQNHQLKPVALLQYLQQMAMKHSHSLGYTKEYFDTEQVGWMLHKLQLDCKRLPNFEDEIEIVTWSQSIIGVKGLRRFEIYHNNEQIIVANTLWLFLDMKKRRVKRVPAKIIEDYLEIELEKEVSAAIEEWSPVIFENYHTVVEISLRMSDIDTNHHVNNTIYADFLETAVSKNDITYKGIKHFTILFQKEIIIDVGQISVGLYDVNGKSYFNIFAQDVLFASGEYCLF